MTVKFQENFFISNKTQKLLYYIDSFYFEFYGLVSCSLFIFTLCHKIRTILQLLLEANEKRLIGIPDSFLIGKFGKNYGIMCNVVNFCCFAGFPIYNPFTKMDSFPKFLSTFGDCFFYSIPLNLETQWVVFVFVIFITVSNVNDSANFCLCGESVGLTDKFFPHSVHKLK